MNDTKTLSGAEILAVMRRDAHDAQSYRMLDDGKYPLGIRITYRGESDDAHRAVAALVAENEALREAVALVLEGVDAGWITSQPVMRKVNNDYVVESLDEAIQSIAARASTTTGGSHDR